tara:strand:+ start:1002 stop:1343 length:342 start_codon:yes stop_codon:yes gene_type:complete
MRKKNLYVIDEHLINLDNINNISNGTIYFSNNRLVVGKESLKKLVNHLIAINRLVNPEEYVISKLENKPSENNEYGYASGGSTGTSNSQIDSISFSNSNLSMNSSTISSFKNP